MTPEQVREARQQLGLTIEELCARLGLHGPNAVRTVRRWEKPAKNESNDRGPTDPVILCLRYMLQDWLPIEMCPKNGTRFDVWDTTHWMRVEDCYWRDGEIVSAATRWSGNASHFRLITAPPGLTMDGYWPEDPADDA